MHRILVIVALLIAGCSGPTDLPEPGVPDWQVLACSPNDVDALSKNAPPLASMANNDVTAQSIAAATGDRVLGPPETQPNIVIYPMEKSGLSRLTNWWQLVRGDDPLGRTAEDMAANLTAIITSLGLPAAEQRVRTFAQGDLLLASLDQVATIAGLPIEELAGTASIRGNTTKIQIPFYVDLAQAAATLNIDQARDWAAQFLACEIGNGDIWQEAMAVREDSLAYKFSFTTAGNESCERPLHAVYVDAVTGALLGSSGAGCL